MALITSDAIADNAMNGVPTCADPYLETELARETWGVNAPPGQPSTRQDSTFRRALLSFSRLM